MNNFKTCLTQCISIIDILESKKYNLTYGTTSILNFQKQINKNNNGLDEYFNITVSTQLSGFISIDLIYKKKLENSTNTITINRLLSPGISTLSNEIETVEKSLLLIGSYYI